MLDIHRTDDVPDTKIYFTHSCLPNYIDAQNVSTKKHPFATFNKQYFTHTLDLNLPAEIYTLVADRLDSFDDRNYARVHMKLGEVLATEFMDTYIKQGNIMMLSEGRPLIDNCISLYDGVLRLELDRLTYERCGLHGAPIEDGGKKHQKQRWLVTFDLKLPSMAHGKKGFGRLEWACKNVLDRSLTWLFWNFKVGSAEDLREGREVISAHQPWVKNVEKDILHLNGIRTPILEAKKLESLHGQEEAVELLEWMNLVGLDSPRVREKDDIDSYLCRYNMPDLGSGTISKDLVRVRWTGFIPPSFAREIFLAIRGEAFKSAKKVNGTQDMDIDGPSPQHKQDTWFSMSAQAFGGKNTWTILQFSTNDTLTWETER